MTAVENGLPVKILILNNRHLGMVRQWQELFYDANYVATDMKGQPDFVKLADAYGAEGYRITTEEELEELLPKALASPRTAVIDVLVAVSYTHLDVYKRQVKLNVDESPSTPGKYGIRAIPTLILFKNGEVVEQVTGAVSKSSIATMIEQKALA